jgi:CRISPR-associated protein Csn2
MIKMNANFLDESVEISRDKLNILVLKNRELFAKTVFGIFRESSELKFFDTEKYDEFRETLAISDVFDFDVNSAKILKILYENLERKIAGEEIREDLAVKFYDLQKVLSKFLFDETNLNLANEKEFSLKDLLKFYGIKIDWSSTENFRENFYQILDVATELFPEKMLIFANLTAYFSSDDFAKITENISRRNLRVLFIENSCPETRENVVIYELDEDMFFSRKML